MPARAVAAVMADMRLQTPQQSCRPGPALPLQARQPASCILSRAQARACIAAGTFRRASLYEHEHVSQLTSGHEHEHEHEHDHAHALVHVSTAQHQPYLSGKRPSDSPLSMPPKRPPPPRAPVDLRPRCGSLLESPRPPRPSPPRGCLKPPSLPPPRPPSLPPRPLHMRQKLRTPNEVERAADMPKVLCVLLRICAMKMVS